LRTLEERVREGREKALGEESISPPSDFKNKRIANKKKKETVMAYIHLEVGNRQETKNMTGKLTLKSVKGPSSEGVSTSGNHQEPLSARKLQWFEEDHFARGRALD